MCCANACIQYHYHLLQLAIEVEQGIKAFDSNVISLSSYQYSLVQYLCIPLTYDSG